MLFKFTHQVAVVLLSAEMAHCPPQKVRFDFNPSTALLESIKLGDISVPVYGLSWYVGFLNAIFSVKNERHVGIYNVLFHRVFFFQ